MTDDPDKPDYQVEQLESCRVCGINSEGHRAVYRIKTSGGLHTSVVLCEKHLENYGYELKKGEVFVK